MPAQHKMSTARGFPYQGNRGSFHRFAFSGSAASASAAPPAAWEDSVSGTLMRQTPYRWRTLSGGYQDHARNHCPVATA